MDISHQLFIRVLDTRLLYSSACMLFIRLWLAAKYINTLYQATYIRQDLEIIQKRAKSFIFPNQSHEDAPACAGLVRVHDHHQTLTKRFSRKALNNENWKP